MQPPLLLCFVQGLPLLASLCLVPQPYVMGFIVLPLPFTTIDFLCSNFVVELSQSMCLNLVAVDKALTPAVMPTHPSGTRLLLCHHQHPSALPGWQENPSPAFKKAGGQMLWCTAAAPAAHWQGRGAEMFACATEMKESWMSPAGLW